MKIEILEPITNEKNPTNCYKFEIGFMFGDADGYDEVELLVDKDNPYLERFINFLERCENFDANEDFEELEDSWLFVEDQFPEDAEKQLEIKKANIQMEWLSDVAREGYMAAFNYYNVTFFDEQGIEHNVKITK
jgi:hypothetical protein